MTGNPDNEHRKNRDASPFSMSRDDGDGSIFSAGPQQRSPSQVENGEVSLFLSQHHGGHRVVVCGANGCTGHMVARHSGRLKQYRKCTLCGRTDQTQRK